MTKSILLLLLFFTIISCNEKLDSTKTENNLELIEINLPDTTNVEIETDNTTKNKYLALGDSYTIGQSVPEKDRFPVLLVNELNSKNYNFNAPKIIAQTGWTTGELKAAIAKENITKKYNLVSLLIGVNNQYRGNSINQFRTEFIELLNTAISFADNNVKNVIVISIPDWGVSPFAENRDRTKISEEIDLFNAVKKEETQRKGVLFVDITGISRQAINKTRYFANDGLHFSGEMHQLWVNKIINQKF
jgi:lysophospholipase L1-like esterase